MIVPQRAAETWRSPQNRLNAGNGHAACRRHGLSHSDSTSLHPPLGVKDSAAPPIFTDALRVGEKASLSFKLPPMGKGDGCLLPFPKPQPSHVRKAAARPRSRCVGRLLGRSDLARRSGKATEVGLQAVGTYSDYARLHVVAPKPYCATASEWRVAGCEHNLLIGAHAKNLVRLDQRSGGELLGPRSRRSA